MYPIMQSQIGLPHEGFDRAQYLIARGYVRSVLKGLDLTENKFGLDGLRHACSALAHGSQLVLGQTAQHLFEFVIECGILCGKLAHLLPRGRAHLHSGRQTVPHRLGRTGRSLCACRLAVKLGHVHTKVGRDALFGGEGHRNDPIFPLGNQTAGHTGLTAQLLLGQSGLFAQRFEPSGSAGLIHVWFLLRSFCVPVLFSPIIPDLTKLVNVLTFHLTFFDIHLTYV